MRHTPSLVTNSILSNDKRYGWINEECKRLIVESILAMLAQSRNSCPPATRRTDQLKCMEKSGKCNVDKLEGKRHSWTDESKVLPSNIHFYIVGQKPVWPELVRIWPNCRIMLDLPNVCKKLAGTWYWPIWQSFTDMRGTERGAVGYNCIASLIMACKYVRLFMSDSSTILFLPTCLVNSFWAFSGVQGLFVSSASAHTRVWVEVSTPPSNNPCNKKQPS